MTADEFAEAWEDGDNQLARWPETELVGLDLPLSTKEFLVGWGLPESAAPFLSFVTRSTEQPTMQVDTEQFVVIGSNGSGDPVVLSVAGEVFYLNHDNNVSKHYINKDVQTLATVLLAYRSLIRQAQEQRGPDAWLDGDVPKEMAAAFSDMVANVDPRALEIGSMWHEEVDSLRAELDR
jgi:hypothetical protein